MGEVGTNSADSPNISIKMNGVNGSACENEPMDGDSQDDSQESSELSVKQSETNEDVNNKKLSLVNAPDGNSNNGDEDEDEEVDEEDEEVDSLKKPTLETITENSQEQPSEDFSNHSSSEQNGSTKENGNKEEGHDEDVEMAAAVINKTDAKGDPDDYDDEEDDVTQGSEVVSENDGIPPVAAASVDVADHDEEDDESTQDSTTNQKNPLETAEQEELASKSNAPVNNGDSSMDDNDVQHVPIEQEVHAISDSDDDEEQITTAKLQDVPPEPMEVDGKSTKENGLDLSMKASVSIISDSENEEEQQTRKNGNNSEVQEISDKEEDCVVIEDDKRCDKDSVSPRRSTRARKSVVKVRDFSAFDDDIEEVVEDPLSQPAAKKLKTSPPMGLTIQDARSLATDPLLAAATFQQQFIQSQGNAASGSVKKEPTLVIIDTNQIMQRGGTAAAVQALQNQNLSIHPVGVPAQGIYSTNMRASITPVMQKSPQSSLLPTLSNKPAPPLALASSPAAAPLLPALTDDMFVLEAPSFIVPYIYEKPPTDNLKDIVEKVGKDLIEQRKQEAKADAEAEKAEAKVSEGNANADEQKDASANNEKTGNEKKKKSKKHVKSGDESWDESDTSTDEEASDTEQRTKVLIKDIDEDLDSIKTHIITPDASATNAAKDPLAVGALNATGIKRDNYFDSPLGKFFMDIGINLVQENVQTDLLRQQKKKLNREGENAPASVQMAINSLKKNLEHR